MNRSRGETSRAKLKHDPVGFMVERFEEAFTPYGKAPCTWGLKIFDTHNAHVNETFNRWLWQSLDVALVLKRENGTA